MRSFLISSLFVAFGFVVGCTSDEEDKGSAKEAASAGSYCNTVCSKASGCDSDEDKDTCQRQCERNQGTDFSDFRSDLVKRVEGCVEAKSCAEVFEATAAKTNIGQTCFLEELEKIAPTEAAQSFCDRAATFLKQCDKGSFNIPGCLSLTKQFNDNAVGDAEGCFDKDCGAYNACLDATLGITIN